MKHRLILGTVIFMAALTLFGIFVMGKGIDDYAKSFSSGFNLSGKGAGGLLWGDNPNPPVKAALGI